MGICATDLSMFWTAAALDKHEHVMFRQGIITAQCNRTGYFFNRSFGKFEPIPIRKLFTMGLAYQAGIDVAAGHMHHDVDGTILCLPKIIPYWYSCHGLICIRFTSSTYKF